MKNNQKILISMVICAVLYMLSSIGKYWKADYLFNYGKNYNAIGKPDLAVNYLAKAIRYQPKQALYYNEIAISYALLSQIDKKYVVESDKNTQKATEISPNNINLLRTQFGIYIRLSEVDPNYLINAKVALDKTLIMAPNDPKLYYNLGLMYARSGQNDEAKKILQKAIELKPNYQEPKNALELLTEEKSP